MIASVLFGVQPYVACPPAPDTIAHERQETTHMPRHRVTHFSIKATLAGALFLGGCGDLITFSNISRQQGLDDLQAEKYDEAQGAFLDAIRQNPRDYQSYYYLGTLYARQGQYSDAVAQYRTSLQVQPMTDTMNKNEAFRITTIQALADALAKVQDRDASINQLETKALDDHTGETYYILGRVYADRGDADSAIDAYGKAADLAPTKFYIMKDYGLYLEKQGQKDQAIKMLTKAYQLNDQDPDVQAALRRLGIVPGPSLKTPDQLAKPLIPKGPLPDYLNRNLPPLPSGGTGAGPAD